MLSAQGRRVGRPPRNPIPVIEEDPAQDLPIWRKPGPIRRLSADAIDDWLLGRLEKIWPGHPPAYWRGRFLGFQASNDYLSICNDRAVLVASRLQHPISAHPFVVVWFCWSRDTREGDWLAIDRSQPMINLYNHCRRWMTEMDGERMLLGMCDDLRGDHIVKQWIEWRGVEGIPVVDVRPYRGYKRDISGRFYPEQQN
jgi:hypothetical protein